ncbi:MAG: hypothetical protein WC389_17440 [Lutibacter sp.]
MPHPYHPDYNVSTEEYFKTGGDCEDRLNVFREYLESRGVKNVETVRVERVIDNQIVRTTKGTVGHVFILWDGKVYNPSLNKTCRFYGTDLDDYLTHLKQEYGYNYLYHENGTIISF